MYRPRPVRLVSGGGSRGIPRLWVCRSLLSSTRLHAPLSLLRSLLSSTCLQAPAQPPEVSAQDSTVFRSVPPGASVCKVPAAGGRGARGLTSLVFFSQGSLSSLASCLGLDNSCFVSYIHVFSCLWKKGLFGNSYSSLANRGNLAF